MWNQYLVRKLRAIGFKQSEVDECVFFKGRMVYVLYTDDSILAGPDRDEIDRTIELMMAQLNMTVEGELKDFLGVNIQREGDKFVLTQPQLIDSILKSLRLKKNESAPRDTPMLSSKILQKELDSPEFDNHFNYRSVIGQIAYLEKGTRPELAYSVHQCSRFSENPRKAHADAVKNIRRYLLGTTDKGMIIKPDMEKSFEVHVDADFCGNWHKS